MNKQIIFIVSLFIFTAAIFGCRASAGDSQPALLQTSSSAIKAPQSIRQIMNNIDRFLGNKVKLTVFYGDPRREITGIPNRRSDWPVYDDSAAIYASGSLPQGLSHYTQKNWGTPLEITGIISKTSGGLVFIKVEKAIIR